MRLTRRQALKLLGTLIVCLCPEKIESYGDTNMDDSNFAKIESGGDITIKDWINTKMDYFFSEKKNRESNNRKRKWQGNQDSFFGNRESIGRLKTLTAIATGNGLGNNIMMLAGSMAYARATGRDLRICWQCMLYENIPFDAIFHPIDGMTILDRIPNLKKFDLVMEREDIQRWKDKGKSFANIEQENICFITPLPFWPAEIRDYQSFIPISEISNEVEKTMRIAGDNPIGIHMRRGDNKTAWRASPTSVFVRIIKEKMRIWSDERFFLCSDLRQDEKAIWREFKDNVYFRPIKCNQAYTVKGIRDAAIDLYCLSHCREIYGSWYSSFSEVAAKIGNIQKIAVKVEV